MPRTALITIRLLGLLCVLYALLLFGGIGAMSWQIFSAEGGNAFYTNPMLAILLVGAGIATLALRIAWLVWYRLTPMNVRHFGFFVGLVSYQWATHLWNNFNTMHYPSSD